MPGMSEDRADKPCPTRFASRLDFTSAQPVAHCAPCARGSDRRSGGGRGRLGQRCGFDRRIASIPCPRSKRSAPSHGTTVETLPGEAPTRYNRGLIETTPALAPDLWATVPAPAPAPLPAELATLRLENAARRAQDAVRPARIREREARQGQDTSNSSRPPSSDPPQVSRTRPVVPSGRQRNGPPGHRGAFRALLPVEQVDEVVVVVPEVCRHCGQPLTNTEAVPQPPLNANAKRSLQPDRTPAAILAKVP